MLKWEAVDDGGTGTVSQRFPRRLLRLRSTISVPAAEGTGRFVAQRIGCVSFCDFKQREHV